MSAAIVKAIVALKYTGNSQLTEVLSFKDLASGCDETNAIPHASAMTNFAHRVYMFVGLL